MPKAADYSAKERLRDGRTIEIRALRPDDREDMLAAIGRTSPQSLRRRFFGPKRGFSETELAFFMNIDFDNHVALIAQIDFVVVDAYQGQGIGSALMRHLSHLARDAGLKELIAEVLPENTAMLKVFSKFGFRPGPNQEPRVVHLAKPLT